MITLIITAVVSLGVAAAWFLVGKREVPRERQEALAELLARGEVSQLVVADQEPALGLPRVGARAGHASCGPCESGSRNGCSGHAIGPFRRS